MGFRVHTPGLVFKAHRLLYHSTLGLRVINTKKKVGVEGGGWRVEVLGCKVWGVSVRMYGVGCKGWGVGCRMSRSSSNATRPSYTLHPRL